MDSRSFYIIGLIVFFLIGESLQMRSFKIIFESVDVKTNKDLIEAKIDIGNNTNYDTVLNGKVNILQNLDDLEISYALKMHIESNNYTTVLHRSHHLCNFLKNRSLDPLLKFVYEGILKHGNFMKSCPIQKGVYIFHEYRVDEDNFPSYVPETNFLAKLSISKRTKTNPIPVIDVTVHINVDKSKGFDNIKLFGMGK